MRDEMIALCVIDQGPPLPDRLLHFHTVSFLVKTYSNQWFVYLINPDQ